MARAKHGKAGTYIYNAWASMIQRCENPNNKYFVDYGARGISVCPEWSADFKAFYRDMGDRPSSKHSLGRRDNDVSYDPGNCQWKTSKQQMRNRRTTKWLELDGERRACGEWAELRNIPVKTIHARIAAGWRVDEILLIPHPSNRYARARFNAALVARAMSEKLMEHNALFFRLSEQGKLRKSV